MLPKRISMISYNIWNTVLWPERKSALDGFLKTFSPDILCLQEAREETIRSISECLPTHDHIEDDLPGWTIESNIFWNKNYFSKVEHGFEKLDMPEKERGFFWVRLKLNGSEKTIFVSTAHFTYQSHPKENETGMSPRNKQTRQTIIHLKKLSGKDEPTFFMGDLNDPVIPSTLFPDAGYHSCFQDLNLLCPPTHPAIPTAKFIRANQTIDWIFSNRKAKTISATVPQFYLEGYAPSDHWPVHAIYELNE